MEPRPLNAVVLDVERRLPYGKPFAAHREELGLVPARCLINATDTVTVDLGGHLCPISGLFVYGNNVFNRARTRTRLTFDLVALDARAIVAHGLTALQAVEVFKAAQFTSSARWDTATRELLREPIFRAVLASGLQSARTRLETVGVAAGLTPSDLRRLITHAPPTEGTHDGT